MFFLSMACTKLLNLTPTEAIFNHHPVSLKLSEPCDTRQETCWNRNVKVISENFDNENTHSKIGCTLPLDVSISRFYLFIISLYKSTICISPLSTYCTTKHTQGTKVRTL